MEPKKTRSYILAYLEDVKEECLTDEAKQSLKEDIEYKEEHPFQTQYHTLVGVLGFSCAVALLVGALVYIF